METERSPNSLDAATFHGIKSTRALFRCNIATAKSISHDIAAVINSINSMVTEIGEINEINTKSLDDNRLIDLHGKKRKKR